MVAPMLLYLILTHAHQRSEGPAETSRPLRSSSRRTLEDREKQRRVVSATTEEREKRRFVSTAAEERDKQQRRVVSAAAEERDKRRVVSNAGGPPKRRDAAAVKETGATISDVTANGRTIGSLVDELR